MAGSPPGLFDLDELSAALDETKLPPTARKILDMAAREGWIQGPITLVIRLNRPNEQPLFARWDLRESKWRFSECRVLAPRRNGLVKLSAHDALIYLQDPTVIYPEEPC